jgi:uncharacterized membrane protein YjjP (DUF1212 family)
MNRKKLLTLLAMIIFGGALFVFLFGGYWEKIISGIILGITVTFGISFLGDNL